MATQPQPVPIPTEEVVTNEVLSQSGLNTQSFGGSSNPSSAWRLMVDGSPFAYPIYRELMEKDTAISSAWETRESLSLSRVASASVVGANDKDNRAQFFQEEASAFMDSLVEFDEVLRELLTSRLFGFKAMEIPWLVRDGRVVVDGIIQGRPQEIFRFGLDQKPQNGPLRLVPFGTFKSIPIPEERFLVSTYRPENSERLGKPILREVFWCSYFKRNGMRLDLAFLEKPIGTVAVQYPIGATEEEQKKALTAAIAINEDTAVAFPENFSILKELLSTARTRQGSDYSDLIRYCDFEMTRKILSQSLATRGSEEGSGSRALGNVHMQILFEVVRRDLAHLESLVNDQLLARWGRWTFGDQFLDRDFRPYWRVDKTPPKDRLANADLFLKLQSLGLPVTLEQVYEETQGRQPEEGDALVSAPELPAEVSGRGPGFGPVEPEEDE